MFEKVIFQDMNKTNDADNLTRLRIQKWLRIKTINFIERQLETKDVFIKRNDFEMLAEEADYATKAELTFKINICIHYFEHTLNLNFAAKQKKQFICGEAFDQNWRIKEATFVGWIEALDDESLMHHYDFHAQPNEEDSVWVKQMRDDVTKSTDKRWTFNKKESFKRYIERYLGEIKV
jgi:hypothetical protein